MGGVAGESLVDGPDGVKRMDEIQPGDRVWSFRHGHRAVDQVTTSWLTPRVQVFRVHTTKGRVVLASADHTVLVVREVPKDPIVEDAEWTPAEVRQRYGARGVDPCSVSPCAGKVWVHNLCHAHYAKWYKYGDPRVSYSRRHRYEIQWTRVADLQVGELVVRATKAPDVGSIEHLPDGTQVTEDVAWLIGLMIGDGNFNKEHRVRLSVFDEDIRARVRRTWRELTGRDPREPTKPKWTPTHLNSAHMLRVFDQMGMCVLGPVKRVPNDVWHWTRRLQIAFLSGYNDADGCDQHTKPAVARSYTSASWHLIAGVRAMHIAHGNHVGILYTRKNPAKAFSGGPSWSFEVFPGRHAGGQVKRGPKGNAALAQLVDSWDGAYILAKAL